MDYIKLYRNILDWEWYSDINTCRLFIHMLLKANWMDGNFRGTTVPRGSFISSIGKLSEETQLTQDEVRTAIKHLIQTHEVTKQSFSKYTVFTVKNYDAFQNFPSKVTCNSQPIPKLFPTIEEYKEIKNIKKEEPKGSKKKFEPPSVEEVRAYCSSRRNTVDSQAFVDFYTSKGWMVGKNKMKDWKAAVRTWERNDNRKIGSRNSSFKSFQKSQYDFEQIEKELLSN